MSWAKYLPGLISSITERSASADWTDCSSNIRRVANILLPCSTSDQYHKASPGWLRSAYRQPALGKLRRSAAKTNQLLSRLIRQNMLKCKWVGRSFCIVLCCAKDCIRSYLDTVDIQPTLLVFLVRLSSLPLVGKPSRRRISHLSRFFYSAGHYQHAGAYWI